MDVEGFARIGGGTFLKCCLPFCVQLSVNVEWLQLYMYADVNSSSQVSGGSLPCQDDIRHAGFTTLRKPDAIIPASTEFLSRPG